MKYNVGDKVRIQPLEWYQKEIESEDCFNIFDIFWCSREMTISKIEKSQYLMEEDGQEFYWTDEMIEGLVEEEIQEITDKHYFEMLGGENNNEINLPEGYQFVDENGNVINATKIVLEKKKEYPKTYEECCEALEYIPHTDDIIGYKWNILQSLQKLLICRDACWKIAGEEMGLGEPWKPDWENSEERRYSIVNIEGDINLPEKTLTKWILKVTNKILVFPTEEMRDAFYENFKELINECKELL